MRRKAQVANRLVDEQEHERLYQHHVRALSALKPSVNTRPPCPCSRPHRHPRRILDGGRTATPMDSSSARCEKNRTAVPHIERRPETTRPKRPFRPIGGKARSALRIRREDGEPNVEETLVTEMPEPAGGDGAKVVFGEDMWETDDSEESEGECLEVDNVPPKL
jgi:hypothetical protein